MINVFWNQESSAEALYENVVCPNPNCNKISLQKYYVNIEQGLVKEAKPYSTKIHCHECGQDYWVNINPSRRTIQKVFDKMGLQRVSNYLPIGEQKLKVSVSTGVVGLNNNPLNTPIPNEIADYKFLEHLRANPVQPAAAQLPAHQPPQPPAQQFVQNVINNPGLLGQVLNPYLFPAFLNLLQPPVQQPAQAAAQPVPQPTYM